MIIGRVECTENDQRLVDGQNQTVASYRKFTPAYRVFYGDQFITEIPYCSVEYCRDKSYFLMGKRKAYGLACLIAAAPELLSSLLKMEARLHSRLRESGEDPLKDDEIQEARAIIAKAEGEQ